MKKILLTLLILSVSVYANAAGTATGSLVENRGAYKVFRILLEAGDEGAFTNWVMKHKNGRLANFDGYIYQAATYPGTTNPTVGYTQTTAPAANYDITVYNSGGYDVFGTQLNNRSATTPQIVKPLNNGNDTGIMNYGPLTLSIANVTNTKAVVTIDLYYTELE